MYFRNFKYLTVSRVLAASVGAVNGTRPRGASGLSGGLLHKGQGEKTYVTIRCR